MIELHIYLEPSAGMEEQLESVFRNSFVPAISVQEGFRRVVLLKVRDALRQYQIELAFESEDLRLKWVDSRDARSRFRRSPPCANRSLGLGLMSYSSTSAIRNVPELGKDEVLQPSCSTLPDVMTLIPVAAGG